MVGVIVLIQEPRVVFLLFVKNLGSYESFQSHAILNKASEFVGGEKLANSKIRRLPVAVFHVKSHDL